MTMHVGETLLPSAETVGELLMIEPKQMQNSGVEIVDGHGITCDLVAEFIRCVDVRADLAAEIGHRAR